MRRIKTTHDDIHKKKSPIDSCSRTCKSRNFGDNFNRSLTVVSSKAVQILMKFAQDMTRLLVELRSGSISRNICTFSRIPDRGNIPWRIHYIRKKTEYNYKWWSVSKYLRTCFSCRMFDIPWYMLDVITSCNAQFKSLFYKVNM